MFLRRHDVMAARTGLSGIRHVLGARLRARAFLFVMTLALLSAPAAAEEPQASAPAGSAKALAAEADALSSRAVELAKKGQLAEAVDAMKASLNITRNRLAPQFPGEGSVVFIGLHANDEMKLVKWLVELQRMKEAADVLERLVATQEALGPKAKHAASLPEWKAMVKKLRASSAGSQSAPDKASEKNATVASASPNEELLAILLLFRTDQSVEALARFEAADAKVDKDPAADPAAMIAVLSAAADGYDDLSRFSKGEALWERAEARATKFYQSSGEGFVRVLLGKARHHQARGDHERAAPLFLRAHDVAKASSPKDVVSAILGLASVLMKRDEPSAALAVLSKARTLVEAEAPSERAVQLRIAVELSAALANEELNRFDDAAASYVVVRELLEPRYRKAPNDYALYWGALLRAQGWSSRKRGDFADAEAKLRAALVIRGNLFGEKSLAYANALCDVGEAIWASGRLAASLAPIRTCFQMREENISAVLATGTEEQKQAYLGSFLLAYQKTLTADLRSDQAKDDMTALAFTQVLRTKGRVLDAAVGANGAIMGGTNATARASFQRLANARARVAREATSARDPAKLKRLEEEARTLETQVSRENEGFARATRPVTIDSVRKALPKDHVLVEIVHFQPLDKHYRVRDDQEPSRYVAYVLHGGAPANGLRRVDLGPAEAIDARIRELRVALEDPERSPDDAAEALYQRVFAPIEVQLGGKKNVIVSPDGVLNTLPFATLMKDGKPLVLDYTFSYVTSGRELVRGARSSTSKTLQIVANPAFEMNGKKPASSTSPFARVRFPALPGTQREAETLRSVVPAARILTEKSATEGAVKALASPGVLHLATHGFFLSKRANSAATDGTRALVLDDAKPTSEMTDSPLLRSGIALAGASSLQGGGGEDGILTALEVASLDLSRTKLVVLSACQTASGETSSGEGVYGLRRALVLAGAESTLLSMWSVDDEATSALMKDYYGSIGRGGTRAGALASAQRSMAKNPALKHPFFWGAFVLSGDGGPLGFDFDVKGPAAKPARDRATPSAAPSLFDDIDDDYEIPAYGVHFGAASMTLTPSFLQPNLARMSGVTGYVSAELSPIALLFDEASTKSREVSVYDRASLSAAAINLGGDEVTALRIDYFLTVGYRARLFGLFAGAMAGTGGVASGDDTLRSAGTFLPLAARLELPWFFESRVSANAWGVKIAGQRSAAGVDVRIPVLTSSAWLGFGYETFEGLSDQPSARSLTGTLGLGL